MEAKDPKKESQSQTNESQDQEPPEKDKEDATETHKGGSSKEIGKDPDSGPDKAAEVSENQKETKDEL